VEVIITDINAKSEKENLRQFSFLENGLIEKGDNSNISELDEMASETKLVNFLLLYTEIILSKIERFS